jgi:hypothetical protein
LKADPSHSGYYPLHETIGLREAKDVY